MINNQDRLKVLTKGSLSSVSSSSVSKPSMSMSSSSFSLRFLFAGGFSADRGSSTKGTRVLKHKELNHKLSFLQHITNMQRG